jgi:phage FluMu protein Com
MKSLIISGSIPILKIVWKCPNCWTEYEIDSKYEEILKTKKDCKFCVRKNPDVPTTAEMDGLLTVESMRGRWDMVFQCKNDNKWKLHPNFHGVCLPCDTCGGTQYHTDSGKSYRTYNPLTDNKKRAAVRKKK